MTKIAVLVGSLQEKSFNKYLAHALEVEAPKGVEFEYVRIDNLPLFNQDLEVAYPAEAQALRESILAADGVLIATPEYNRSVPGVLKNALDWASRPYGENAFKGKPLGIVGATITPVGTAAAQAHLRTIALFLEMKVLGQPEIYVANAHEVFGAEGELESDRWRKNFKQYMEHFTEWVKQSK